MSIESLINFPYWLFYFYYEQNTCKQYELSVGPGPLPRPAPLPLVHVLANDVLDVLFLLLGRQGRRVAIIDAPPLLQLPRVLRLARKLLRLLAAGRAQDVLLEQGFGVAVPARGDSVFLARRLVADAADLVGLQVLRDPVRGEIERLLGDGDLPAAALLLRLRRSGRRGDWRAGLLGGLDVCREGEQLPERGRDLWLEVLALLHAGEVVLQIEEDGVELPLVGLLPHVELYDAPLQHRDQVQHERVVGLLLLPGREPRVDRHFIYIYYYCRIRLFSLAPFKDMSGLNWSLSTFALYAIP